MLTDLWYVNPTCMYHKFLPLLFAHYFEAKVQRDFFHLIFNLSWAYASPSVSRNLEYAQGQLSQWLLWLLKKDGSAECVYCEKSVELVLIPSREASKQLASSGEAARKLTLPVQATKILVVASERGFYSFCVYVFLNTIADWAKPKEQAQKTLNTGPFIQGKNTYVRTWGLKRGE